MSGSSTLTKGLDLLRLMGKYPHGAPAAVFARESGLPFSTAYRLLNTLTQTEFAEFDPETKQYRIGLQVFELSQKTSSARGYHGALIPVLKELSRVTNESCLFSIRDGNETVTIHTVDGPEFRQTTDPGDRLSLHVSSMGKAILAALPPHEIRQVVAELELEGRTARTITDTAELLAQLDAAREAGWVYQSEEVDLGMNALATAVMGADGSVLGAVAIAAPIFRAGREDLLSHRQALQEAAQRLTATLPTS